MKALIPIFFFLFSCSTTQINLPIKKVDNFFLCFPETDSEYQYLDMEKKIEMQQQISQEKFSRNLDCGIYSNYVSGEENLSDINAEQRRQRHDDTRYIAADHDRRNEHHQVIVKAGLPAHRERADDGVAHDLQPDQPEGRGVVAMGE